MNNQNDEQKITQIVSPAHLKTLSTYPRHSELTYPIKPEKKADNPFQKAVQGLKAPFEAHKAAPGPVLHPNIANVAQEGTQEERRAKAAELNK
ncbi:hypothetical protein GQ53DRAFT_751892 [Thozetella sp. PMI_491]|nr:hypothetical protein GQ53DRAFT_751892 [Thozetella sp. PMI_491]